MLLIALLHGQVSFCFLTYGSAVLPSHSGDMVGQLENTSGKTRVDSSVSKWSGVAL